MVELDRKRRGRCIAINVGLQALVIGRGSFIQGFLLRRTRATGRG